MAEDLNDFRVRLAGSLDGGWDDRAAEFEYLGIQEQTERVRIGRSPQLIT